MTNDFDLQCVDAACNWQGYEDDCTRKCGECGDEMEEGNRCDSCNRFVSAVRQCPKNCGGNVLPVDEVPAARAEEAAESAERRRKLDQLRARFQAGESFSVVQRRNSLKYGKAGDAAGWEEWRDEKSHGENHHRANINEDAWGWPMVLPAEDAARYLQYKGNKAQQFRTRPAILSDIAAF